MSREFERLSRIDHGMPIAAYPQALDFTNPAPAEGTLKASLVTGGTVAATTTATTVMLEHLGDDGDSTPALLTGLGSALLLGVGVACRPGSAERQAAIGSAIGGLTGLLIHVLRESRKPTPSPGTVGVEVHPLEDALDIIAVRDGSPAARAGIEIGDKILAIDGHRASTDPKTLAKRLVGPSGHKVSLTIRRPRTWELLRLTLIREAT